MQLIRVNSMDAPNIENAYERKTGNFDISKANIIKINAKKRNRGEKTHSIT